MIREEVLFLRGDDLSFLMKGAFSWLSMYFKLPTP